MPQPIAAIFGASGFVGRSVVERLAEAGFRIRAASRRPNEAWFLKPLGAPGQIEPVYADITKPETVEKMVRGAEVVINCVGILFEGGQSRSFRKIQAEGPGVVARLAQKAGVKTMVHISAIGADEKSPARYARTKARGEKALRQAFPGAVILRPSIIFGPADNFFNAFAKMARAPFPPLTIVGPKTRFQPVYVEDIAVAVVRIVQDPKKFAAKTFELGGPEIFTFREVIDFILRTIGKKRRVLTLPFPLAGFIGFGFQVLARLLPLSPPITLDQVKMLKTDNVVSGKLPGFEAFGIEPDTVEAIVPAYLTLYRARGQFA